MDDLFRARWVRWWWIWVVLRLWLLLRRSVIAMHGHVTERCALWRDTRRKWRRWLRRRIRIGILLAARRVRRRRQRGWRGATRRRLRLILTALGIPGGIGVSGNRKEVNVTNETHIVYFAVQEAWPESARRDEKARGQDAQLVIVNFCIGSVCARERIKKLELYDRRWIERSAVLASIPEDS